MSGLLRDRTDLHHWMFVGEFACRSGRSYPEIWKMVADGVLESTAVEMVAGELSLIMVRLLGLNEHRR